MQEPTEAEDVELVTDLSLFLCTATSQPCGGTLWLPRAMWILSTSFTGHTKASKAACCTLMEFGVLPVVAWAGSDPVILPERVTVAIMS